MMKKILVLATCMVFLLAGVAQADYLRATWIGGVGVSITDPPGSGTGFGTIAGPIVVSFGPSTSDFKNYDALCVDYATISQNTWYNNFTMIPIPSPVYREAAYIFANYGNGPLSQLAVWEVVFEQFTEDGSADTLQMGGAQGKFYVTSNPNSLDLAAADAMVQDAIAFGENFDASSFRLLVSPSSTGGYYGSPYQDFLVRVPEPGVLTLLGLGLVALGITRRRTK